MRPISLSVPAPLLETFKQFAKRTETPQSAVLMDAITAHQDDLSVLVSTSRPAVSKEGLFVRDIPRESVPLSTLSLRMRAVNIDAIDQLVDATGAGSRSHLCVAALAAYLSTNR
jgi:metal-responsive CopG/Arc/MetJ family transcriptional regulator